MIGNLGKRRYAIQRGAKNGEAMLSGQRERMKINGGVEMKLGD